MDENKPSSNFLGICFERQNLGLPVDTEANLTISPKDIEVVSEDHSDKIVYLESMIYKGAYNEFIVYTEGEQLLLHSQTMNRWRLISVSKSTLTIL